MASKNQRSVSQSAVTTHQGGPAAIISPLEALKRSVLACLLWEKEFYEDGETIAARIDRLVALVPPSQVGALAIEARSKFHLRHVPLWLSVCLDAFLHGQPVGGVSAPESLVRATVGAVIQRPDEITEILALYRQKTPGHKRPISHQIRRGIADAFRKFDRYQLAKYAHSEFGSGVKPEFTIRDAMFLCHPKPVDEAQAATFKALADKELEAPDTWESALAAGKDKKETFERLMAEQKLPDFAFLRNVRGMEQAGVDRATLRASMIDRRFDRILPFRFFACAKAAPWLEPEIDMALMMRCGSLPKLPGETVVLVDVSASMDRQMSGHSQMTRMDAASSLAALVRAQSAVCSVATFSEQLVAVPPRHGMALRDAIVSSQEHGNTALGEAVTSILKDFGSSPGRLVVITDEQAQDKVPQPPGNVRGYMVNVASAERGVGYGRWMHLDGLSEALIPWIAEHEAALHDAAQ